MALFSFAILNLVLIVLSLVLYINITNKYDSVNVKIAFKLTYQRLNLY